jgi:hypothetical protein
VSLNNNPKYECLSYSWDAQSPAHPITIPDGKLLITANCASALQQFRPKKGTRTLWIDSICIDQLSTKEKDQQVGLMGEIYRKAEMVLVWLGEADPEGRSKKALDIVRDFGNIKMSADEAYQRRLAKKVTKIKRGEKIVNCGDWRLTD